MASSPSRNPIGLRSHDLFSKTCLWLSEGIGYVCKHCLIHRSRVYIIGYLSVWFLSKTPVLFREHIVSSPRLLRRHFCNSLMHIFTRQLSLLPNDADFYRLDDGRSWVLALIQFLLPEELSLIQLPCIDYPLNGRICCARQLCLHSGHSGFSLAQSLMHVQQNTCPQVVTLGSFIPSRHKVHFLLFSPIQAIVSSSFSSYLGFSAVGVFVHFCSSVGGVVVLVDASKSSALLALYALGSSETSAPPPTKALVPMPTPKEGWVLLGDGDMVFWRWR